MRTYGPEMRILAIAAVFSVATPSVAADDPATGNATESRNDVEEKRAVSCDDPIYTAADIVLVFDFSRTAQINQNVPPSLAFASA